MLPDSVAEELPRERLARAGVEALSDGDLLALVLRCGHRGASARALAVRLRAVYPTLEQLAEASPAELAGVAGVGPAHAASICAALALGRRAEARVLAPRARVAGSEDVFRHLRGTLGALRQERFYALLLDGKGRLMREVRISEGSLTASLVHPREVFRAAVREAAASVILAHNHPSGDPEPSPEDVALTTRLAAAGEILGIRVLDHVVIGRGRFVSFADSGRLGR